MPSDRDKSVFSRREFVKGSVYAALGLTVGGYAFQNIASMQKPGRTKVVPYDGALNVGGPAPRPIPLIPMGFNGGNELVGKPESLDWLWYCGLNEFPGIREDATDDNRFYYVESPEGTKSWYDERAGDVMKKEHFIEVAESSDYNAPVGAGGAWREVGGAPIPVIVVYMRDEAPEASVDGFLATSGKCVHLCCVPGFNISPQRFDYDSNDLIFCTCHKSRYDPKTIVRRTYLASKPPED